MKKIILIIFSLFVLTSISNAQGTKIGTITLKDSAGTLVIQAPLKTNTTVQWLLPKWLSSTVAGDGLSLSTTLGLRVNVGGGLYIENDTIKGNGDSLSGVFQDLITIFSSAVSNINLRSSLGLSNINVSTDISLDALVTSMLQFSYSSADSNFVRLPLGKLVLGNTTLIRDTLTQDIKMSSSLYVPDTLTTSAITLGGRTLTLASLSDSTKFDSVKYVSPKFTGNVNPYFSTITSALNNAGSGTLIIVYPGTYDEQIKGKNGVTVWNTDGVNFSYTADNNNALITDDGSAINFSIRGNANFTRISSGVQATILHTSNSNSKVIFEAKNLISTISGAGANWVIFNSGAEQYIKFNSLLTSGGLNNRAIYNESSGFQKIEILDSIKTENGYAFYNVSAIQNITANYIIGGVRNASGTGTQIVNGNYIIATTNNFLWNAGTLQIIKADIIDATLSGQTAPITVTTGEVHINASIIKSDAYRYGGSLLCAFSGGIVYINADIVYAPCTVIQNTGATLYGDINYLYTLNDTGHCIRQTAGTSYMNVVDMTTANQPSGQGSYSIFNIVGGYCNLHVTDSLISRGSGYGCIEVTSTGGLDVIANVIVADSGYACLLQGTGGGTITANVIQNKAVSNGSTVIDINSASGKWTIKNAKIIGRGTAVDLSSYLVSVTTANSFWWNTVFYSSDLLGLTTNAFTFYLPTGATDVWFYGGNYSNVGKGADLTEIVDVLTVDPAVE